MNPEDELLAHISQVTGTESEHQLVEITFLQAVLLFLEQAQRTPASAQQVRVGSSCDGDGYADGKTATPAQCWRTFATGWGGSTI
jgi:hypothetical protein